MTPDEHTTTREQLVDALAIAHSERTQFRTTRLASWALRHMDEDDWYALEYERLTEREREASGALVDYDAARIKDDDIPF